MRHFKYYSAFFFLLCSVTGWGQNDGQIGLVTFDARQEGAINVLYWSAFTEANNDYYTVERSFDGVSFESLEIVNGAENQSLINTYSSIDLNYSDCINYYRLKQTNIDGIIKYSTMASIDNRKAEPKQIVNFFNLLGNEVDRNYKGVVICIFSDHSIEKIVQ
jgi:hypothetical protein